MDLKALENRILFLQGQLKEAIIHYNALKEALEEEKKAKEAIKEEKK